MERIQRHLDEPDARTRALAIIKELLPLDAERRAEMEVNIALIAEAPAMRSSGTLGTKPMKYSETRAGA